MAFLITAITKVERDGYDDIIWAGGKVVEVKPTPIAAFCDIETLVGRSRGKGSLVAHRFNKSS
jgi:hypothetical protein